MCVYVYVCMCIMCVYICVFCFVWGIFCTKRKPMGLCPGERMDFHIDFDVFYGNLVNFSLYFLTYNYIYLESVIHFAT